MQYVAKRVKTLFIIVLVFLVGLGVFLVTYLKDGDTWALSRRNGHIYTNGMLTGAGTIYDTNGEVLSQTVDGERTYHEDSTVRKAMLHALGDSSGYITSGVQWVYNKELSGYNFVEGVWELKTFGTGSDITLTLDAKVSKAALDALGSRKGAVAVYNYKTGEMISMVSSPTYDIYNKPSNIEDNEDYEGVYLNRVISGLYPPGSTFKTITAASAIEMIGDIEDQTWNCTGVYSTAGGDVICNAVHGKVDFYTALAKSCNYAFADIANQLGEKNLMATAEQFGFNTKVKLDNLNVTTSKIALDGTTKADLGWAGIGQYTTLATPYQMMVAMGAIANGGTPVTPYVIEEIKSASGMTIKTGTGKNGNEAIDPAVAAVLQKMLRNNVENQYGNWQFNGLTVAGKSGTAEVEENKTAHAWFAGYCLDSDLPLAFAVIIENGGSGSNNALPIANAVLQAAK